MYLDFSKAFDLVHQMFCLVRYLNSVRCFKYCGSLSALLIGDADEMLALSKLYWLCNVCTNDPSGDVKYIW